MNGDTQEPYDAPVSTPDRATSPISQAAHAAALQTIREGTPLAVQETLAAYEASGDIVPDTEQDEEDISENDNEETMDGEINVSDDDDSTLEGWDDDPSFQPDVAVSLSGLKNENDEVEQDSAFELTVRDGTCRFERPEWARWRSTNKRGQDVLDDMARRFMVLEKIAQWLNTNRIQFLKNPDPWLLGCDALAELRDGRASVSPGDFLDIAEIRLLGSDSMFSRNKRATILSWEDGTLSLEFLFGREARMAWVANAVQQLCFESGASLPEDRLNEVKNVTIPKNSGRKTKLSGKALEGLDLGQFIARANLMAATKWENVLGTYRNKLLEAKL